MINKINEFKGTSPIVKIAAFIIIIAGAIYSKSIINPILLALFVSIICIQPISWLVKKRIPKWLAFFSIIMGLLLLFFGFAYLIGGTLSSFSGNVAKYETSLNSITNSLILFLNEKGFNLSQIQVSNIIQPSKILEFTSNAMNKIFNMMGNTFLIFLILLFILTEFGSFTIKAKAILTESDTSISYLNTIIQNIRHYLWIKTLICLATGIFIYIALVIIGLDYPLLWALIAALMNYIPNIGSILAVIPALLFAMVQFGISGALWTLASYLVVNNVLGNIIEPKVMGKGLGLSTLVVFISLLFWGFVLGTVGMFLSVPLTMTFKIVLEQNEKTRWIAILLGTPAEAKIFLRHRAQAEKQHQKE
ncbi:MAG: AI-2E family transporter [Bacteroidales bacterium]